MPFYSISEVKGSVSQNAAFLPIRKDNSRRIWAIDLKFSGLLDLIELVVMSEGICHKMFRKKVILRNALNFYCAALDGYWGFTFWNFAKSFTHTSGQSVYLRTMVKIHVSCETICKNLFSSSFRSGTACAILRAWYQITKINAAFKYTFS